MEEKILRAGASSPPGAILNISACIIPRLVHPETSASASTLRRPPIPNPLQPHMFKKVFALGLVASAAAAGAPATNNLRLRGGFASGFAKLTEAPGEAGAC